MTKPTNQTKKSPQQQANQTNTPAKKVSATGKFLDTIKDSLTDFSKMSEEQRTSLYGNQEFLSQFWEYFKKKEPDLLGGLSKEELPKYLAELEKKGFSIHNIVHTSDKLHAEFAPKEPEREVMQETLGKFNTFCKDSINNIPAGTFKKFADEVGFDHQSFAIPSSSKLQTIDHLYLSWKSFAEKENITLLDNQKKNIENVLCPDYDPVERIMVEIALTKLRKELKGKLKDDFDDRFALPVTAFSALGNLRTFQQEWIVFLDEHAGQIDENLVKELDSVMVYNGDIKKLLMKSGKKFDQTKSFEEREHYFLRVFNKLATRQLFEEVRDTKKDVEKYVDIIHEGVKGFPPYVNELFKLYPYDDATISQNNLALHGQLSQIDTQITQIELTIASDQTSKEEKNRLRIKRKQLKQQKEEAKWQAYISYLATKDQALATVMTKLVGVRFDFTKLSIDDQQIILNVLVKHKLNDLIAHKAPELLGIDATAFKEFTDSLFDLSQKELIIPNKEEPIHIIFKEKKFLSQQATQLLSVNELSQLKSLPLQFVVQPTPSSQEFFERGVLRGHDGGQLFDTFQTKNGPVVLNDGYEVKLTKDGKTVRGYLSQYPPADIAVDEKGTGWYMYSQPVTDATQERKRVTRENTDQGTPVVISQEEEETCILEVVDRSFALNGEAIGSLIFAYVLGQQSLYSQISPDQEKKLAAKLGKIDTFLDKQENHLEDEREEVEDLNAADVTPELKEKTDYDEFLGGRKALAGYDFPENKHKENAGFTEGSKIFIKGEESELPPKEIAADTWMHLDIEKINKEKGTVLVTLHGGEFSLGDYEGVKKEIPLKGSSWDELRNILGTDMYKVPAMKVDSFDTQLMDIKKVFGKLYAENFAYTFDTIKSQDDGFEFTQGDYSGAKVAAFGYISKVPEYKDRRTIEVSKWILFDVKRNSNGTYHVSCKNDGVDEKTGKPLKKFTRDMDPVSFALFIAGKKLQPKASEEVVEQKNLKETNTDKGFNKKRQKFSIRNAASFFKNSVGKIQDSMKKYDEERAEDLTDIVLKNGDLFTTFGKLRGGLSERVGESFEAAGLEYYTTRDARVWKKIEKWQKMYEQEKHYPTFFHHALNGMITGKEVPKDIYKIPAMLLTIINKENSPYARHFDLVGKGHRVNMILGKDHQQRYIGIMNEKMADLKQNSALHGTDWTVQRNEEIIKLEMKYLVDVIDMREHGIQNQEIYQSSKWSRAFAEKLDESMRTKFGFNEISSKHSEVAKSNSTTFEFAEFEFARHTRNAKPKHAFPYFKVMAEQAQTQAQRDQFEMHVVASTLSGWFQYGVDANTQGWLKDICRSRGFIPGLFAKDIHQQTKMLDLMNIFLRSSGKTFQDFEIKADGKSSKFALKDYSFGNMNKTGWFVADGFKTRWFKDNNGRKFSKFLDFSGKDIGGNKTLIELAEDPTLTNSQRALLEEYIKLTNETSQDIDADIKHNPTAMAGTPFTKCETIVKEMLKYDEGEFEGKDSHEKAGPAEFRSKVTKGIPKGKATSTDIIFYIGKFLNWFDGVGFADGTQKMEFIKRLLTVQKMLTSQNPTVLKEAEDMLWYTINGTILKFDSAGKGTPPKELEAALDAFKSFFKTNLDQILSPHILSRTMSDFYAKDEDTNTPYEIGNRSEYVEVVTTRGSLLGGNAEKNRTISKKYNSATYSIYKDLYGIAEDLDRSKGQRNRFKNYYKYKPTEAMNDAGASGSTGGTTSNKKLTASGVAIINPQNVKKEIQNTLNGRGKTRDSNEQHEIASLMEEEE